MPQKDKYANFGGYFDPTLLLLVVILVLNKGTSGFTPNILLIETQDLLLVYYIVYRFNKKVNMNF